MASIVDSIRDMKNKVLIKARGFGKTSFVMDEIMKEAVEGPPKDLLPIVTGLGQSDGVGRAYDEKVFEHDKFVPGKIFIYGTGGDMPKDKKVGDEAFVGWYESKRHRSPIEECAEYCPEDMFIEDFIDQVAKEPGILERMRLRATYKYYDSKSVGEVKPGIPPSAPDDRHVSYLESVKKFKEAYEGSKIIAKHPMTPKEAFPKKPMSGKDYFDKMRGMTAVEREKELYERELKRSRLKKRGDESDARSFIDAKRTGKEYIPSRKELSSFVEIDSKIPPGYERAMEYLEKIREEMMKSLIVPPGEWKAPEFKDKFAGIRITGLDPETEEKMYDIPEDEREEFMSRISMHKKYLDDGISGEGFYIGKSHGTPFTKSFTKKEPDKEIIIHTGIAGHKAFEDAMRKEHKAHPYKMFPKMKESIAKEEEALYDIPEDERPAFKKRILPERSSAFSHRVVNPAPKEEIDEIGLINSFESESEFNIGGGEW